MSEGTAERLEAISEDTLLRGRLRLLQPRSGHRAGTDAVLVAAAAAAEPGETIVDLGAGTGAVGLIVAARTPGIRCVLVEGDPLLAGLCRENLRLNGQDATGLVLKADILAPREERMSAGLKGSMADVVATNPPFSEAGEAPRSPDRRRASAHELPPGGFKRWIETCADLLKPRGRLALIQRTDRLAVCLEAVGASCGSVRIWPVHPKADRPAIRIVLTAVRGGRGALTLEPPLVLHEADGRFTERVRQLHEGALLTES